MHAATVTILKPQPVQAAAAPSKTLLEECRQGAGAKGDSEVIAPMPKSSYVNLDSGLTYADMRAGNSDNEIAEDGKRVNIQWVLRRSDGYFVDSSEVSDSMSFIFTIGDDNGAIKGINDGVKGVDVRG